MKEFRRDAGTRYNHDIISFIDRHPQVGDWLRNNIDEGWYDIYYQIYKDFMN